MSTSRGPIIAVGDLVWDVLVKPDRLLLPGGDTSGRIALSPGGSAANVAAWVARVGEPAAFIGKVGSDTLGNLIVADLEGEGVQVAVSRSTSHDTGVVLVLIDRAGQRSMVTNQGADFQLLPADLPYELLRGAAHVHITGWSLFTDPPRTAALEAAQMARAAGATVSFDPGSYQMILELGHDRFQQITAALPVNLIFPNREEGEALTGEREPGTIAAALRRHFPHAIVALKLDREGCYILADDHARHYAAGAGSVIDATGAGDAFDAAFLARYLRDGDLEAAARFANAIGSWVVGRYGARPPADADLLTILKSQGESGG